MATISIFGYIGADMFMDGVTLKSVSDQLKAFKNETDITVQISSGGGSVNEGKAIYSLLKNSGKNITVEIIGQAYSIASVIAMAGNKVLISDFGDMMLHPAWIEWTSGNADDLRETADDLEAISTQLFDIYMSKPKLKENETKLKEYFDAEKFISATECIELGLCDGLIEDSKNKLRIKQLIPLKAVAFMDKKNKTDMLQISEEIKNGFAELKKMFKQAKPVNNSATFEGGTTVYYDGDAISNGTKLFSDEEMKTVVADGTYKDANYEYVVTEGAVSGINPVANARVTELETALAEQKTAKEAAEAKITELETALAENKTALETIKNKFEDLDKKIFGSAPVTDGGGNPKAEPKTVKEKALNYFNLIK